MIGRALRLLVAIELLAAAGIAFWLHSDAGWSWAASWPAGLAAPATLHAVIVGINFGLAAHASSPTPPQFRLSPGAAARTYVREYVDSFRTFQVAMPWLAGRPLPGEAASGASGDARTNTDPDAAGDAAFAPALPVVFVHGYLCNRQLWRPLARRLAAGGHAVAGVDLEPVFGSIDDYAPIVADAVDALRRRTGAPRVALVGHSMGGLAIRAYLRARGAGAVAAVVTLGSPHRGTFHARFGQGRNARQMRIDSEWLRTLAAAETGERGALFTVVYSHHDNVVAPQAGQTLPGARAVPLAGIGHLSLAYDPAVHAVVEDALRRAAVA